MKKSVLAISLLLLFAVEISRVYFIMPFPGSQRSDSIGLAYWLHNNILWIRVALALAVIACLAPAFKKSGKLARALFSIAIILYGVVFFFFNFRFQADKMFYQPRNKAFSTAEANQVNGENLVIGVVINGVAKAYPIQLIGYHHQVRDTINDVPVMVTYCTVCRTGRVYSPFVDGKPEQFRLVGMDHFNAMFEDAATKSWWQQATGISVAGKLKGKALPEIPSEQAVLHTWLAQHPGSLILQPDTLFNEQYASLEGFDKGTIASSLEKRDSMPWGFKSWVVGIAQNGHAKAYDWNRLVKLRLIQDSLPGLPVLLTLQSDTASFHVFSRAVRSSALQFRGGATDDSMIDENTGSIWNASGFCVEGPLKGEQLHKLRAYQEFWHSWKTFHPQTLVFE